MDDVVVDFEELEWQSPICGARHRGVHIAGERVRVVEFRQEFEERRWCDTGHTGIVLEGELELVFEDGRVVVRAGQGLAIPHGPGHRHRARALTEVARLFLVDRAWEGPK